MSRFIKKVFVVAMVFFGCNVLNVDPLKRVSLNNQVVGGSVGKW